jgi:hypothetical protein
VPWHKRGRRHDRDCLLAQSHADRD